ncbi:MAG TPA: retroviral-like aspartic protease family protein [Chroococcales cyanobacterium]
MSPRKMALRSRIEASACLLALLAACSSPPAHADQYFDAGVREYSKKSFQKALSYFQQASRSNPYDPNSIYYQALSCQQLRRNKEAIKLYAQLVSQFGYSDAGKLAGSALARLDPTYYRQLTGGSPASPAGGSATVGTIPSHASYGSSSSSNDNLPAECRIRYEPSGSLLKINGQVNGRSHDMVFDTGASATVFGKNHLHELGIQEPTGKSDGSSMGVGSSGTVPYWRMSVTLKVGDIERKNFPILVQDNLMAPPLLGQTFFQDFQYSIHPTAHEITFTRKSSSTASSVGDRNSVPFRREGNELIVMAEVNGRQMAMYFDTGAANCAFSKAQLRSAGIPIPEDAVASQSLGVGGITSAMSFTIRRMKLGPIDKQDVQVSAVDEANMQYPLLGQSFFSDWQYTIDNANHVIHFLRR